jgi:hypothetical protein
MRRSEEAFVVVALAVAHSGQAAPVGLVRILVLVAVVVWLVLASLRRKRG